MSNTKVDGQIGGWVGEWVDWCVEVKAKADDQGKADLALALAPAITPHCQSTKALRWIKPP